MDVQCLLTTIDVEVEAVSRSQKVRPTIIATSTTKKVPVAEVDISCDTSNRNTIQDNQITLREKRDLGFEVHSGSINATLIIVIKKAGSNIKTIMKVRLLENDDECT